MNQLENVILAAFRSFAFLHSQGQKRTAIATCPTPSKITFAQTRAAGVRGVLVYCSDYRCSHSTSLDADRWADRSATKPTCASR
jgi:hypothetical protein